MDKFVTLEPVRLYASASSGARNILSRGSKHAPVQHLIGRLPVDIHILILCNLSIPEFMAYSLCSRSTAALVKDERIWARRWKALCVEKYSLTSVVDELENRARQKLGSSRASEPPTLPVDDDFGDFASVDVPGHSSEEMGDFIGAFNSISMSNSLAPVALVTPISFRSKFIRAHNLLRPLTSMLSSSPHIILTDLGSYLSSTNLRQDAKILHLLSLYLSQNVQPLRKWSTLYSSLRSAMDRFDANLLAKFDMSDSKADEKGMCEAAEASWEVWDGDGDWEMGKVWAEKREIFYEHGKWRPEANFTEDGRLNFDAMHEFMDNILLSVADNGARAVRVFPPESNVLISFCDRVATEVVGEYVASLLSHARDLSNSMFLVANAATFRESWRMVDVILEAAKQRKNSDITIAQAEDVVFRMFETNMDEYLDEEIESLKATFDVILKEWNQQHGSDSARFLSSRNPAQVKRNVLASFADILLLPVTIVPRAVGGVVIAGGNAAFQGISMLNPQRWVGNGTSQPNGYSKNLEDVTVFETEDHEDDELVADTKSIASISSRPTSLAPTIDSSDGTPITPSLSSATSVNSQILSSSSVQNLDLNLSLDVALELIHADREALKRVETFSEYPGHYGHRVRDTIEELFILMLQDMSTRHLTPGFALANEQMTNYKPTETTQVAPLLQFFELVHLGDTIQSMVQVYFDKELASQISNEEATSHSSQAPHIDKTDFLNAVVREKKRFENALDDSVASGLNAGTDVLMNQVDHIILTLTKPREYYPPEDSPLELGPTLGCTEAIKCLDTHCKLLKGSTSKDVLEVFHQEVGIRLIAILQKHIKRQIISLQGGFQVIADLNAYYTFIASLKVASLTAEFSHLKMLGHVFVVEDAKDLAQIVRDVTRYGGAYRPEDIYEFIQRRSDWKQIEKTVDKTMYNLSFKEDCIII